MASPLPKTNAPASAKYHAIVHNVPPVAAPARPVIAQSGSGDTANIVLPAPNFGGALMRTVRMPQPRKIQTISDSVQAVTRPLTPKIDQSNQSFDSVIFPSFHTLRAMMAMTAAPIP